MRARVLFVSDHPEVATAVSAALRTQAFEVHRAANKADAAARLEASDYDVFIVDIKLADAQGGLAFLSHLKTSAEHLLPHVVVISADAAERITSELLAIGICDIVPKPVRAEDILAAVEQCLDSSSARVH
jgi:DNA-binding response OmpR family regulator